MAPLTRVAVVVVVTAAMTHSWTGPLSAQEPHLTGQWRVEYRVSEGPASVLLFEARPAGTGSFLSLDTRRSNLAPAVPGKATWTRALTRVRFSGEVEMPIGNVGYHMRRLEFDGAFTSPTVIVGDVVEVRDVDAPETGGPRAKGTFRATRMRGSIEPAPPPNERSSL